MLYSILIYGYDAEVNALTPEQDAALIANHVAVQEQLQAEGKLGPVVRLRPTPAAITLKTARAGSPQMMIDGPFAETKEQLLGLYVVDCATREEAVEAARLIETCCTATSLEIRPVAWFRNESEAA